MDSNNVGFDLDSDLNHQQNSNNKEKTKNSGSMTQLANMNNIWGNSPEFSGNSPSTSNHLQALMHPPGTNFDDATPNILLEQLAFVDNFMTDIPHDFNGVGNTLGESIVNPADAHQPISADVQLALDERLAAELSIFADESFIFPDEDKNDGNNWEDGANNPGNGGLNNGITGNINQGQAAPGSHRENNDDGNNGNSNSNNGGRNNSERRHLLDRKANLIGNQYVHTKQRFSKNRIVNHNSPTADHGGFTNFDVQENPSRVSNREIPVLPSPLSTLLATHDLTSQKHFQLPNSSVSSAGGPPASSNFQSNIQMPDYSNIQTSTLVSLLPRLQVPKGAYESLRTVGFRDEQIDAIAAIMAYYERERDKFENPGRPTGNEKVSSSNPHPTMPTGIQQSTSDTVSIPRQNLPRAFEEMVGYLNETPQEFKSGDSSELPPNKKVKRTPKSASPPYQANSGQAPSSTTTQEVFGKVKAAGDEKPPNSVEATTVNSSNSEILKSHDSIGERKDTATTIDNKSKSSRPKLPDVGDAKKMKEKDMENWMNDFSELARDLKQRIQTLEMENRLLKDLVLDRGDIQTEMPEVKKCEKSENE